MQSPFLCGVRSSQAPPMAQVDTFSLRIKAPARSEAMSLSVALKRPDRSFGGTMDSRASNFTAGSARTYISVVCMLECPSQSETFRRSLVACKMVRAQECLNTCGDTRFDNRDGQRFAAEPTCLRRMYSKPERVSGWLLALRNNSGTRFSPLTPSHACSDDAVCFHKGRQRCLRPLPWISTLASA